MTLVVEDGTGLSNAESYVSVADADAYFSRRGVSSWGLLSADQKEQALVRATDYIDARYQSRFSGAPTRGRAQARQWPRQGASVPSAVNATGYEILLSNEIPRELKAATLEAARLEADEPGRLTPEPDSSGTVTSESVGPISVSYAGDGEAAGMGGAVLYATVENAFVGLLMAYNPYSSRLERM